MALLEQGKKMVQEVEGLKHILNVIKRALELKQGESTETLKNMSVGFLVNYLADQQNLKQKVKKKLPFSIFILIIINTCFFFCPGS